MLSSVYSNIRALKNFLARDTDDSSVQSMKKMPRQSIEKGFMSNIPRKGHFNVLVSKVYVLSKIFDPRYKLSLFPDEQKYLAKSLFLPEIKDQIKSQEETGDQTNITETGSSASNSVNSSPNNKGF